MLIVVEYPHLGDGGVGGGAPGGLGLRDRDRGRVGHGRHGGGGHHQRRHVDGAKRHLFTTREISVEKKKASANVSGETLNEWVVLAK